MDMNVLQQLAGLPESVKRLILGIHSGASGAPGFENGPAAIHTDHYLCDPVLHSTPGPAREIPCLLAGGAVILDNFLNPHEVLVRLVPQVSRL